MTLTIFPLRSDKSPAVGKGVDWKTYKGEAKTPMVGIVVPSGAYVIDLDLYKGVTPAAVDKFLGCSLPWKEAEIQETKGGGKHYAFKVDPESRMKQGADLFGIVGFDTRAAGRGYIATGEGYKDATLFGIEETLSDVEDLPELPLEAVAILLDGAETGDSDFDDLAQAVASQPEGITLVEIKAYLDLIPSDAAGCPDRWWRIGMGICHETQGSEEGWQLFDNFSKRAPEKYDQQKNRTRWDSFGKSSRENPITIGTVRELAGGQEARKTVTGEVVKQGLDAAETLDDIKVELKRLASVQLDGMALDVALKAVQEKYGVITGSKPSLVSIQKEIRKTRGNGEAGTYFENYVFCTASAEYVHRETKAVMGPRAFDVKHTRDTPNDGEGNPQSAGMWSNDKIEVVENTMYFPKAGEVFTHDELDYLNSYVPSRLRRIQEGTTDIVARIRGHIAHLLVSEEEQDIVINYLAHNVQYPGEKIAWSPVLQGVQGDGKSLLAEMMQHVLGISNVRIMNVQTLESSFTGWATGQCMTFIEELKLDNFRKYEVLNNLKPYISNPTVEETKKGKDPRTVINTTNYFALTNFKDAIPIDSTDRRYCIMFSQWQSKEALEAFMDDHPGYYPDLYDAMRNHAGEILDWLLNLHIPEAFFGTTRAPHTEAKSRMEELSKSPEALALEDAISMFSDQIKDETGQINVTILQQLVREHDENDFDDSTFEDFPSTRALKNAMMRVGYQPEKRRKAECNGTYRNCTFYSK